MNKTFKSLLGIFAAAMIAMVMTACGHGDTQSKVDSANADIARNQNINIDLLVKGVNLSSPTNSQGAISKMDNDTLDKVEALVTEFIARGSNIVSTAKRDDVSYPVEQRQQWEAAVGNAQKIKDMIDERRSQNNLAAQNNKPAAKQKPSK